MKTYTLKAKEVESRWHVLDADGERLGRLATRAVALLRGKYRPTYTPHMDNGDFVVIVNASKVEVTGKKTQQKVYRRHTGYPGGLKETTLSRLLETHPERVIESAVKGMLPHNKLARQLLGHLKVYGGPSHPHQAQVGTAAIDGAASPSPPEPAEERA